MFVELAAGDASSGDPSGGEESLSARRTWTPPTWFARMVAALPRAWVVAALAVLVGGLLAADQAVRSGSAVPASVAPMARTAGVVYADRGHCPAGIDCTILTRPRPDMWDSYNTQFDDTRLVGGAVWFESRTGVVYYQELDASGSAGQTIALAEQRLVDSSGPSFGPTVDFVPDTRHAGLALGRREAIVTTRRGAWLVTASLAGSPTARLPIAAAISWTVHAPLPGG